MLVSEHLPLQYDKYREFSKTMAKMCDLVDLFGGVNKTLIQKVKQASQKRKPALLNDSKDSKDEQL